MRNGGELQSLKMKETDMNRCGICGRLGNWHNGFCDTCLQTKALEERNRIDRDRLRSEEEQRKRDRERDEREQRNRNEQLRQDREREAHNQRLREEQLRLDKERDEQDRKFREEQLRQDKELREEQLRIEQERNAQEREDRLRAIEAQEEANRIEQQRYEDEQREKNAREWAERKKYLDRLSNAEVKEKFESYLSDKERSYLESRYRCCLSKEEELEFIKDKEKFVEKKIIKNRILFYLSTSDESFIYSYISTLDTHWFEKIIEQENYLKEFPQINFKIPSELEKEYQNAENAEQRKKIIGMSAYIIRLKNKAPIDRQIYFREYLQKESKEVFDKDLSFEDAVNAFCVIRPILNEENEDGIRLFWNSDVFRFYRVKMAYLLFSKLEPLYLEALSDEERKEYLEKKYSAEKEGEKYLKEQKQKDKEEQERNKEKQKILQKQKEELQRQREIYQREFDEKKNENEKLVTECNEINKRREERPLLYEKSKKSRKNTIRIGCASPFIILFIIGTFTPNNQVMNLSAAAIMLLLFVIALIRTILLSVKMKKLLKEDANDDVTQNGIVEKSKQLVARLNELQKLLSK